MKAYRLMQWGRAGQLVDVPKPEPGPGQVLLKVAGNGICQSDLHAMYGWTSCPPHLDVELPLTIGHEVAGWVETCGRGVTGFEYGLPGLLTIVGCGRCRYCAEGWDNYCLNRGRQIGMGLDGGLAEYIVAPAAAFVPLRTLEPWKAAPLTDAGLSSYHAVRRILPLLTPGSTVVVIGIGGLGHMAVSILKALCAARIVAVDKREQSLALAKDLGADLCLVPDDDAVLAIRQETGGSGVQAVLDFVGGGATIGLAAQVIGPLGHIVVVGRGQGSFEFKDRALPYGAMLSTTFGGRKLELIELVELAEAGVIEPHVTRYPLSDVQLAFERLKAGKIAGRAVIVPDGHEGGETRC